MYFFLDVPLIGAKDIKSTHACIHTSNYIYIYQLVSYLPMITMKHIIHSTHI